MVVNDLFYTQSLASNLGFTGDNEPPKVTLKHFDDDSVKSWGKTRTHRLHHLADLRGVSGGLGQIKESALLKLLAEQPKALYVNTGDRTPSGCIWAMLLEKAWTLYLIDRIDTPGESRTYRRCDAEVNMARTTVEKACLALAGWNGAAASANVIRPSRFNDLDHGVFRAAFYARGNAAPQLDGTVARDIKISKEHMTGGGRFETCSLMWTRDAPTGRKVRHR